MSERRSRYGLENQGLNPACTVYWNLAPAPLIEFAVKRGEGHLAAEGPFNAVTVPHTGRSPNDKFIVRDATTEDTVAWGKVNAPIAPEKFGGLLGIFHDEGQRALPLADRGDCEANAEREP